MCELRKTYKFRFYTDNAYLHQQINVADLVWNHALALSRCYYRLYGKGISFHHLQTYIAKLRRKLSRKQKGSINYNYPKAKHALAHQRIADKRKYYFFKLAHQLCDTYCYTLKI